MGERERVSEREREGQPFFSLMRVTSVESGIAVCGLTFPFSERQRNAWNTKKLRGVELVGVEGVAVEVKVWVCERDMWQCVLFYVCMVLCVYACV